MNFWSINRWRTVSRSTCASIMSTCGDIYAQHRNCYPTPQKCIRRAQQSSAETSAWKQVYREFLMAVHPDFFHDHPLERAMNEKNLKVFQQHLHELDQGPRFGNISAATHESSRLVFFLKPGGAKHPGEDTCNAFNDSEGSVVGSSERRRPSPRKVILPLNSHYQMATLLHEAGIAAKAPPPASSAASLSSQRPPRSDPSARPSNGSSPSWVEDLFAEAAPNRAWYEAAAKQRQTSKGRRNAFSRSYPYGSAHEYHEGETSGPSALGHVLITDEGRALVRERRLSARNVRRLVEELRKQYGFGEFTFRCGWSKSNLCVALVSLLETCGAHRRTFRVPDFRGLEVIFRNDSSVLHEGEIWLCPADVPLDWVSVLQRVTPAVLSDEEHRARDLAALEEKASTLLRGVRLARGLSCSEGRYRQFLGEICVAGPVFDAGVSITSVSHGDWSGLRCKVEEGFGRASKVLEDGTIQVGSDMTPATLWQCLGRDSAKASSVATESARLALAASLTATRCRQLLGLAAIQRDRAVNFAQMEAACEALVKICEVRNGGEVKTEVAAAARMRLRGHFVRVVGARACAVDGVTEDGEIAVPWDWAGEVREGNERGAASSGWSSFS